MSIRDLFKKHKKIYRLQTFCGSLYGCHGIIWGHKLKMSVWYNCPNNEQKNNNLKKKKALKPPKIRPTCKIK